MIELAVGADDVARTARCEGRAVHVVRAASDLAGTVQQFASALRLRGWLGRDVAAFAAAVRSVPGPVTIVWAHVGPLRTADPASYQAVLDVLVELDAERDDVEVAVVQG